MEESGSPREDSKNSSRETNKTEELSFERSVRSYECVFCKRGFTTAQALGGHMNIHRKHRAPKINPNSYCPSSIEPLTSSQVLADGHEGYESYRPFFANIQSYPQWHFGDHDDNQVRVNNQKYSNNRNSPTDTYSTSASTVTTTPSNLFRDTSLNLGIVPTRNEEEEEEDDDDENEEKIIIGDFREDHMDVDLELRLGYDH